MFLIQRVVVGVVETDLVKLQIRARNGHLARQLLTIAVSGKHPLVQIVADPTAGEIKVIEHHAAFIIPVIGIDLPELADLSIGLQL